MAQLKCNEDARSKIDGPNCPGAPEKPKHPSDLHRIQPWHHYVVYGMRFHPQLCHLLALMLPAASNPARCILTRASLCR